jgi:hypothetical protein
MIRRPAFKALLAGALDLAACANSLLKIMSHWSAQFLVCLILLASCESPSKTIHVNPSPQIAQMLKHPALRISDSMNGKWARGQPQTAGEGWTNGEWLKATNGIWDTPQSAGAGIAMILATYLVYNTAHSAIAPSSEKILEAKKNILLGVQKSQWEAAFHDGFASIARKHGVPSVARKAARSDWNHSRDVLIDVVVNEAGVSHGSSRPRANFTWGLHKSGRPESFWWGHLEVESSEKKSFMAWGSDDGASLAKALHSMFQEAGAQLARELYEGADVTL